MHARALSALAIVAWFAAPAWADDPPIDAGVEDDATPTMTEEEAIAAAAAEALAQPEVIELESTTPDEQELANRQFTGAGDVRIATSSWRTVPRAGAAHLLTLAPGIFLTQTGGAGHPEQIFLRGFDAREGQDIEFTVDGIPVNDVGNPHGHGLADLHFLIPEVITGLRVQEGPFRVDQGDFAVAGTSDFTFGTDHRGTTITAATGSFGTRRGLMLWGGEDPGTFAAVEGYQTTGYGAHRAGQRAAAIARWAAGPPELRRFGLATGYVTAYDDAGLVRADDVAAGRIDRFGTTDDRQGGASARLLLAAGLDRKPEDAAEGDPDDPGTSARIWLTLRDFDLRENYTGFLLDPRRPGESPHGQRGDLLAQHYLDVNTGLRVRDRTVYPIRALGPLPAMTATIETGIHARLDVADGTAVRLRAQGGLPYRTELDYRLVQGNVAGFAALELRAGPLTVRGGARLEALMFDLHDRCAGKDTWFPGAQTDDVNCPDQDRYGTRLRAADRQARGLGLGPRASAVYRITGGLAATAAYGIGLRSIEALSLSADEDAPFAKVHAAEAGAIYHFHCGPLWTQVRGLGFRTQVDNDLVFDEESGKNVYAGETVRTGALLDGKLGYQTDLLKLSASGSVTGTRAVFGASIPPTFQYHNPDRVPGKAIPYVPGLVARADLAADFALPRAIDLELALGADFVSDRPLPQGEAADALFVLDAGAHVHKGGVTLGLAVENVLDRSYALAEYNFASWFPEVSDTDFPTRVPARHVAYGAPRSVMLSLSVSFDRVLGALAPPPPKEDP